MPQSPDLFEGTVRENIALALQAHRGWARPIPRAEQRRLAELRVGVVGLSVGHSTALTLALEGVGGELRLADFDTLALSNLNRLRTGLHVDGGGTAATRVGYTAMKVFGVDAPSWGSKSNTTSSEVSEILA